MSNFFYKISHPFSTPEIKRHFIFWCLLILYLIHADVVKGNVLAKIVFILMFIINVALWFYIIVLILFEFWNRSKLAVAFFLFATLIFFVSIEFFNLKVIIPSLNSTTSRSKLELFPFIKRSVIFYFFTLAAAVGTFWNRRALKLFIDAKEVELQLKNTELTFLKNQFNTHLTFNFFNYCYADIIYDSPETADLIEDYSEMIRYSLNSEVENYVTLKEELKYIDAFLNIHSSINSNFKFNYLIKGLVNDQRIIKMFFPSILENAIKYGSSLGHAIQVEFHCFDNYLEFKVQNLKRQHNKINPIIFTKDEIEAILQNFYIQKYELEIIDNQFEYMAHIKININNEKL